MLETAHSVQTQCGMSTSTKPHFLNINPSLPQELSMCIQEAEVRNVKLERKPSLGVGFVPLHSGEGLYENPKSFPVNYFCEGPELSLSEAVGENRVFS